MKKLISLLLVCLLCVSAFGESAVYYVNKERGVIVRESPDLEAPIAGYLPYKEDVLVLEEAGSDFVKITYEDLTGYCWAKYLTPEDISEKGDREMYVTAWAGLYMHKEADMESEIVTGVPFGTKVTVKQIGEDFSRCYVILDDQLYKGYLWTGYLSSDTPDAEHAKEHHDAIAGRDEEFGNDGGNDADDDDDPTSGWDDYWF